VVPKTNEIKISCKDLGAMALEDFCPRCFWIKRKAKQLPWQTFPGIFSSIDAYTKNFIHAVIDRYKKLPDWMPASFREVVGYQKALHWSKFKYTDPKTGLTISGVVDDILVKKSGIHCIPDYKTAKFTDTQDKLLPMYEVQLNGYAIINESLGNKTQALSLVYCEPVTEVKEVNDFLPEVGEDSDFYMGFTAHVLEINKSENKVFELLDKAKYILEGKIPDSKDGCKDCQKLENIMSLVK
jgi:hypothetical protein